MDNEDIAHLIARLAPQIGASIIMEPVYQRFGMIIFQNGKRVFFKHNQLNINMANTVAVTTNKFETNNYVPQ